MRRQLVLIFAMPFAAAFVAACGMVTGLSDDFTFDGGEGGSATGDSGGGTDAAGDGGGTDGGTDARFDGSGGKCGGGLAAQAFTAMNGTGTLDCRTCLSQACCTAVINCHNDCGQRLQCELDCTTKGNRSNCDESCVADKPSATFSGELLSCAKDSCNDQCAFQ